ncbi:MAG: hypothetical protein M3071_20730 [Actinomycetota bacterium]|nr:hypothetical protein [Actinomycetota bacterium]
MAAALSIWIALVAIAASAGGGLWAGIAFAVVAAILGVSLGVRGLTRGR